MRSRRDQVQAHAYVMGRLTSALVHGEPDAPESPLRRTGLGTFAGLMLGALGVAAFMVWGLISPASSSTAPTAGELLMVKETGARYIYADGALRPVLNWSSALLLTGGKTDMTSVSESDISGIRQGQPLGIVGAPDSLPAASSVNRGDWLACTRESGGQPRVSLSIGSRPQGTALPSGSAVVVSVPGARYMIWQGERIRLDASWITSALGLSRARVIPVSPAWLNSVPAGPDLRPISVAGAGARRPSLGGSPTRVGEILMTRNVGSGSQLYAAEPDGVASITATQAAILLANGDSSAAYGGATAAPVTVSPATIAHARSVSSGLADASGLPASPPAAAAPAGGEVPCMEYAGTGGVAPRLVFAVPPAGSAPALDTPGVSASPQGADRISVAAGGGALVRPQAAPGVAGSSLSLVTDTGIRYPLPAARVAALGYRVKDAASLPAALLGLLPTGPALDLAPLRG